MVKSGVCFTISPGLSTQMTSGPWRSIGNWSALPTGSLQHPPAGDGYGTTTNYSSGTILKWSCGIRRTGSTGTSLESLSEEVETLSRWNEGAILRSEGERLWYASGSGIEEIPRPPGGFDQSTTSSQIGILIITKWVFNDETSVALYSPDGETWIEPSLPQEMRESILATGWSGASYGIAASHNAVLVRVEVAHSGFFGSEFDWFLGTPVSG